MASQEQYLAAEVALWFQEKCGAAWEFLGCHNLTGVSVPRGDTNPVYCRTGKNKFSIERTWRGTPGLGTVTIAAYDTILNELQEAACAFNLAALYSGTGADDDPTNFDFLYYYNGVEVTSEETDTQVAGMSPDEQAPIILSMPASFRERLKVKGLTAVTIDVSSLTTNDILAVTFCDEPSCDNFGNLDTKGCQTIFVSTAGATAVILKSTDGGGSWSSIASPFTDADANIVDIKCDNDVVIAVNGEQKEYAYSWDGGTSWTVVTTPTKVLNQAMILGGTEVWFVGQDGYIYKSSNRGSSVSVADAGQATSQSLNDISAASSLLLYAVGDNNAFLRSTDGGNIWSAVTGPAAAIFPNDLYRVLAIPGTDIVFVADEQGNTYRSEDNGDTWTSVLGESTQAGGIYGLVGCDCNVIMTAGNLTDPYFYVDPAGVLFQSVDGGNSWFGVEVPTNTGIRDMVCCDVNTYWVVGDAGFVAKVAGPA